MTPDLTPSRLELHMARGSDNVWHAWLYDPATDEIVATCQQTSIMPTLAVMLVAKIMPILNNY